MSILNRDECRIVAIRAGKKFDSDHYSVDLMVEWLLLTQPTPESTPEHTPEYTPEYTPDPMPVHMDAGIQDNKTSLLTISPTTTKVNKFGRFPSFVGNIVIVDDTPTGMSKLLTRTEEGRYIQGQVTINGKHSVTFLNAVPCYRCIEKNVPCVQLKDDTAGVFNTAKMTLFAKTRYCGSCVQAGKGPGGCSDVYVRVVIQHVRKLIRQ